MLFFRHRIAFGALMTLVLGAVKVALDIVYKVLKLLKLQFLAAVLFVGAILFIFNVIPENTKVFITFIVFAALGFIYFVAGNLHRISKFFNKFHKEREKEAEKIEREKEEITRIVEQQEKIRQEKEELIREREEIREEKERQSYPKYYAVKEHKGYVMAEYPDRYVLYRRENGKLYRVRTDRKD